MAENIVRQSLPLCLLFSALGGSVQTFAYVVITMEDDREKAGKRSSPIRRLLAMLLNVLIQALATLFLTLGPRYGPVSLVQPTMLGARLLSNMVVFGGIMGKGDLSKDTQVATLNCAIAIVLLPLVGPSPQDGQAVEELLLVPYSLAWNVLFSVVFVAATIYMLSFNLKTKSQLVVHTCLLSLSVSASVLSSTVAKALVGLSGWARISMILYYTILNVAWSAEAIVEASAIESLTFFVPLFAFLSLTLNAVAGLLVWEDWRAVSSWTGYGCVFLLLLLGVYLLSDLELYKTEQEQVRKVVQKRVSTFWAHFEAKTPLRRHSSGDDVHSRRYLVGQPSSKRMAESLAVPGTGGRLSDCVDRKFSFMARFQSLASKPLDDNDGDEQDPEARNGVETKQSSSSGNDFAHPVRRATATDQRYSVVTRFALALSAVLHEDDLPADGDVNSSADIVTDEARQEDALGLPAGGSEEGNKDRISHQTEASARDKVRLMI